MDAHDLNLRGMYLQQGTEVIDELSGTIVIVKVSQRNVQSHRGLDGFNLNDMHHTVRVGVHHPDDRLQLRVEYIRAAGVF